MRAPFAAAAALLAGALLGGLIAGCAAPATSAGIVPAIFDVATRHAASVSVSVTGGRDTGDFDAPQISNEAFAEAVTRAIEQSGVFASVTQGSGADYRLAIQIFRVESPVIGFTMRANMEAGWTLLEAATNKREWRQSIASDFAATTSDSAIAARRGRLAVEGAARDNIQKGVAALSRLPLEQEAK